MANLEEILHGADTGTTVGLFTYLDAALAVNFEQFQIRGFNFGTERNDVGYRVRDPESTLQAYGDVFGATTGALFNKTITVGRLITVAGAKDAQIQIGRLVEEMDGLIYKWSQFKSGMLAENVTQIRGSNITTQDTNIPSGDTDAWAMVAIREFNISYFGDP